MNSRTKATSALKPVTSDKKIFSRASLKKKRRAWKKSGLKVGFTNGCFDLLHKGHVTYLQKARGKVDRLIVGINSDDSVRQLNKGPNRPINCEGDRAFVLAGLTCVDAVVIFSEKTALGCLQSFNPDVFFKGGDYTLKTLDQGEVSHVQSYGGRITLIPMVAGRSTTLIIKKMKP
ncbi:MAG: adenylyltransferase/cytidyltransferase family protein [Verrucomicrobiota bacterium]|nr:adenylyltransferase/cytidyltransferase family protein [Verrucomicrobiota bacterium]